MEEDIKILESIVKVNKDFLQGVENQTINQREIQAIENLIARNKELESALNNSVSNDEIKEVIQRIDYDVKKTREVKLERYSDYDRVRLKAYITKSNEIKRRLQELLNKGE